MELLQAVRLVVRSASALLALFAIYGPFGDTPAHGHSFTYRGSAVWGDDVIAFPATPSHGAGMLTRVDAR
jgi:hypothetical protein